jgi:hypothetical protein
MDGLSNYLNGLRFPKIRAAFVGAAARKDQHWEWVSGARVNSEFKFWGPRQPSGDGECGNLIKGEEWDNTWLGYGWKLNDEPCQEKTNFICQKTICECNNHYFVIFEYQYNQA